MIFISHAWNNSKPDQKVLQFVDFLRKNGYEAECDILYQQQDTAIHFTEMMAEALRKAEKTIIILSEDYKTRADNFQGGVGSEYRYIIDDFSNNKNKYILISFGGRHHNIVPDFLKGRDIIDLEEDSENEYRQLFSKLSGTLQYDFSPVAGIKTIPSPKKLDDFQIPKKTDLISKLGLDFTKKHPLSDFDKKKFLRNSFQSIVNLLKKISDEFCSENKYFQIEHEETDSLTVIFEIYKNGRKIHAIKIWFGSLSGGHDDAIFVGNNLGSKSSFSEMIRCEDLDGKPMLVFLIGKIYEKDDGTVEGIVKQLWESNFNLYLRME